MGKAGNVCMLLGTALVLAALSLFLWNQREAVEAGRAAEAVLPRLVENMEAARTKPTTPDATLPDPYDPEMTVVEIDGYGYVGVLTIPALELELPMMSEWDAARLKIAPCRYSGSTKTRDLVIAGHNYTTHHFGTLYELEEGDKVIFTDMDGVVTHYQVVALDILQPTAVEEMTAGAYDLTLFTCTYDSGSRLTVRCNLVTENGGGRG